MTRSKRGKGKRRLKHHPPPIRGSVNVSSIGLEADGSTCRETGESAKPIFASNRSTVQAADETNIQRSDGVSPLEPRCSHSWLSRRFSTSSAGAPAFIKSDGLDSLLEGLTGTDLQTAKLIVGALRSPEDLSSLRRLAVTHGFVNNRIRAVVWPRLLGLQRPGHSGSLELGQLKSLPPSQNVTSRCHLVGLPTEVELRPMYQASTPCSPSGVQLLAAAPQPPQTPLRSDAGDSKHQPLPDRPHIPTADLDTSEPLPDPPPSMRAPLEATRRMVGSQGRSDENGVERGRLHGGEDGGHMERGCPGTEPGRTAVPGSGVRSGRCDSCGIAIMNPGADIDGGGGGNRNRRHSSGCEGGSSTDPVLLSTPDPASERPRDRVGLSPQSQDWVLDSCASSGRDQVCGDGRQHDPCYSEYREHCDGGGHLQVLDSDWQHYLAWSERPHRDSAVVEVDVARSLWAFTRGLSEQQREARRQQLKRLLNAVVAAHEGDVFYYQGLHDVAGVLLLSLPGSPPPPLPPPPALLPPPAAATAAAPPSQHQQPACTGNAAAAAAPPAPLPSPASAVPAPPLQPPATGALDPDGALICPQCAAPGPVAFSSALPLFDASIADSVALPSELLAFSLLHCLVTTHLRDATRRSLEPVVQLLSLVPYMVHAADPALAHHLETVELQPFFALSWLITWWAHELDDLSAATRLYDFFLSSHPLMPLYLGAVAMRSQRSALLNCKEMPELHSALMNLKLGLGSGGGSRRSSGGGGGGGDGRALVVVTVSLKELVRQAEQLWRAKPPYILVPLRPTRESLAPSHHQLRQRRGGGSRGGGGREGTEGSGSMIALTVCVAHAARLDGCPALWQVPGMAPEGWPAGASVDWYMDGSERSGLGRILVRASSGGRARSSRSTLLSTALLAGVYVAAAVAIGYATFSRVTGGGHQ